MGDFSRHDDHSCCKITQSKHPYLTESGLLFLVHLYACILSSRCLLLNMALFSGRILCAQRTTSHSGRIAPRRRNPERLPEHARASTGRPPFAGNRNESERQNAAQAMRRERPNTLRISSAVPLLTYPWRPTQSKYPPISFVGSFSVPSILKALFPTWMIYSGSNFHFMSINHKQLRELRCRFDTTPPGSRQARCR